MLLYLICYKSRYFTYGISILTCGTLACQAAPLFYGSDEVSPTVGPFRGAGAGNVKVREAKIERGKCFVYYVVPPTVTFTPRAFL